MRPAQLLLGGPVGLGTRLSAVGTGPALPVAPHALRPSTLRASVAA